MPLRLSYPLTARSLAKRHARRINGVHRTQNQLRLVRPRQNGQRLTSLTLGRPSGPQGAKPVRQRVPDAHYAAAWQ